MSYTQKTTTIFLLLYCLPMQAAACIKEHCVTLEHPLAIIITGYNNKEWYKKNLAAVFSQHYNNYRIIYIDDCSTDGTADLVEEFVRNNNQEKRVTLIKNKTRQFKMANLWHAIHICHDDEIIIEYDGDDWFAHDHVFERINKAYEADIWLTYSDLISWPTGKPGPNTAIPKDLIDANECRKFNGCFWSMLRTYYAWLAKKIALKDLLHEGRFMTRTSDVAIMLPMIDMAGHHFAYIQEVLYVYNVQTSLNDAKVNPTLQKQLELLLRRKKPYQPLPSNTSHPSKHSAMKADVFIFTDNKPEKCLLLLESIANYMQNIGSVYIYNCSGNSYPYKKIMLESSTIHCIDRCWCGPDELCNQLMTDLQNSPNGHVIIAHESNLILNYIDINECITSLEKTKSYAFFLTFDSSMAYLNGNPPLIPIDDQTIAWQFSYGKKRFNCPESCSMALYEKNTVLTIMRMGISMPTEQCIARIDRACAPQPDDTGLCFAQQKATDTRLLLNVVQSYNGTWNIY
jgi:glycosyltransferase involved in cell wall biosynthesis